ncbi:MAG: DUF1995 family protein [Cyanobacteria bacterium P01_A01_bin.105]
MSDTPAPLTIPTSLTEVTEQAMQATQAAIAAGITRLQIEMVMPELQQQPIAHQFLGVFETLGLRVRVYFPDAGAAALAKRDWGNPDFVIRGITERASQPTDEDEAILIVSPSSVEVAAVEQVCQQALDRPVVLLNPQLENIATIGIGYAGRQLRERFLSTLESVYYFRPLEGALVLRRYPEPWQVWQGDEGSQEQVAALPQRPNGEQLDRILFGEEEAEPTAGPSPLPGQKQRGQKRSLLAELQQFLRALSQ